MKNLIIPIILVLYLILVSACSSDEQEQSEQAKNIEMLEEVDAMPHLADYESIPVIEEGEGEEEEAETDTEKNSATRSENQTQSHGQVVSESKEKEFIFPNYKNLGWDDLLPDSWRPDPELVAAYERGDIDETDPRIVAFREMLESPVQPANQKLDGQKMQLNGFVVPLEQDGKKVKELLLVPYFGACIHVPPPPTNQTIYVRLNEQQAQEMKTFDTAVIAGTLKIEATSSDLAEAGYRIEVEKIKVLSEDEDAIF